MRPLAILAALLLVFPVLGLAGDDDAASKVYAIGDKVKDFSGKDPQGFKTSLADLKITAELAAARTIEIIKGLDAEQEITKDTLLEAVKGLQDDDGDLDDGLKTEVIGLLGRQFGLVATDDQVDEMTRVGDLVKWLVAAKDAPIAVILWSSGCATSRNFYNEKMNEVIGEEHVRLYVVASEQYDTPKLVTERLEGFPFYWKVVMDQTQAIKDLFVKGGTRTPYAFLLDKDHVLRYRGAIDSNPQLFEGDEELEPWLRDAIQAVKAGKPVTKTETDPKGCPLKAVKK